MKKFLFIISLFIIIIAPFYGQVDFGIKDILNPDNVASQILFSIRIPRVILAFLSGGILSLGGLVFQSIFKNPMATPFTLGVASGATLFTAIGIVLGLGLYLSFFAFLGAVFTIVILFSIAYSFKFEETTRLLLVGIALSFFYSASLMIVFFVSNLSQSYEIVQFTMGSLDTVGYSDVFMMIIASVVVLVVTLFFKKEFQFLNISDDYAKLKGVDVSKVNNFLLLAVSLGVGISVSITGPIGFVGLIIPHIIKLLYKKSSEKLIIPIFFYGGLFLVLCDFISRNLGTTSDIPIGVVTSFLGAPFFVYLLIIKNKN